MKGRWDPYGFGVSCFLALILVFGIPGCWSLNGEGLALLDFRARIDWDPYGALQNWSPNDSDPCMWSGVSCVDGEVQMLDLSGLSLDGTLAPELRKLCNLQSLILFKNHFSGAIPKEIGELAKLEQLDLRDNNLSGAIPAEIGIMPSLKHLLLCDNKFEDSIPLEISRFSFLPEYFDDNLTVAVNTGIGCMNRKFGHCIGQINSRQLNMADSYIIPIKGALTHFLRILPLSLFKFGKDTLYGNGDSCCNNIHGASEPHKVHIAQKLVKFARRRLLEHPSNLAAESAGGGSHSGEIIALPTTRSSGAFPAVPNKKKKEPPPSAPPDSNSSKPDGLPIQSPDGAPNNQQHSSGGTSGNMWKYIIAVAGVVVLLIVSAAVFCVIRSQAVTSIGPWKTGLSGQLQKAFLTGVPKLNRAELETACEDFSNIIDTLDGCTIYKGTLSSGVEIAVASTLIKSSKDWPKNSEMAYRKKIDTLSRVNHKNFVNLIGYCEEDEPPFVRMMVFEYAPNGSLFEHLHVKEVEHLDWNVRMRIIMGTAYCLQYMHHDLNPPVSHSNLNSTAIYLTDDYAAKIGEISFGLHNASNSRNSVEDEKENSELPPLSDPETNIYSFGILLLEIISGKLPYSEEQGHLVSWAADYLNDKRSISYMIDPTLKSFKNDELDVICEVIEECIRPNPMQRPTMKSIISKLREVISISPEQATPRLSPLWWAELEILSVEAT
ncbi:protein MALE DISCOVERER 2-like isoform X2 [Corylus avellana]|uniref:protein MALE DISCOVERER 2-like isoform X2 n=1 Tax=Corylus avellana TaxID=13451 RepID=UPI001E23A18C|nr:protein MALE DISCOVERER 2-like isoform X2 [Corylus avellana]